MSNKKPLNPAASSTAASTRTHNRAHDPNSSAAQPPPTVSARWLLSAASIAILAAAACGWLTLCLLFWQGSWQLLYHPRAALTRTPASAGLAFDSVAFAATEAGLPSLKGWWISASPAARYQRFTVLYLHDQSGNLSDTVDALAVLHGIGVNVLAFDYRGYGESEFAHPSEARWREDAQSALAYLTTTRHISAGDIVLHGEGLGANLALAVASAHSDLAGVVLDSPVKSPVDAIFADPRARLVPAHLLVRDRFSTDDSSLRIPSLWLLQARQPGSPATSGDGPEATHPQQSAKTIVRLTASAHAADAYKGAYARWLDDLPGN